MTDTAACGDPYSGIGCPDPDCKHQPTTAARNPTVPQQRLIDIFVRRGRRAFRVLRSAEAPLVRYRRDQ